MLEFMKRLVLWKDKHECGCRLSQGSLGEALVMMVYQKPETLNQTKDTPVTTLFTSRNLPGWLTDRLMSPSRSNGRTDREQVGLQVTPGLVQPQYQATHPSWTDRNAETGTVVFSRGSPVTLPPPTDLASATLWNGRSHSRDGWVH